MNGSSLIRGRGFFLAAPAVIAALCLLTSCERKPDNRVQGYVEGEFIYVASPLAGALESLPVQRGMQVKAGDTLFTLASVSEKDAREEAESQLKLAGANLDDAKVGKRPSEIASVEAQLRQAQAGLALSEQELARQEKLAQVQGASSKQDFDRARSAREQDAQRVAQIEADLVTAKTGARTNQIAAAEANERAMHARLARAVWDLDQKSQRAPQTGIVFDTLYRQGEWVAAGHPVVALLPPQNIKVRAFVPEGKIGSIHAGDRVEVIVDGVSKPYTGKVSFISPQAEYTPPVIYSQESRGKLVFMIEAVFEPDTAAKLNPGQPVDVQLNF